MALRTLSTLCSVHFFPRPALQQLKQISFTSLAEQSHTQPSTSNPTHSTRVPEINAGRNT